MEFQSVKSGPWIALLSAGLFGVSPVLVKLAVGEVPPVLLAGLLYLGSGVGLLGLLLLQGGAGLAGFRSLSFRHGLKLAGAIVAGGILAPVCLVYGLRGATAFEASVLLNLETVTTTLIAWLVFREHVGARVWIGKLLLIFGGLIIALDPQAGFSISGASALLFGACFFWGVDNNLTRDVEELSPTLLALIKGIAAGAFNCLLALYLGQKSTDVAGIAASLGIGAVSYGLSLVLFIGALRRMGASRTSTYFAAGPFFGMVFALGFLGERPELYQWISALFMAGGLGALYHEHHEHPHTHEATSHRHPHLHDEHHQHVHDGSEGPEPHEHFHSHEALTHAHVHWPDIHHRHSHG